MKVDGCELCEAAPMSRWYHEDATCWVADCESCDVPIVVWKEHGAAPPDEDVEHMLSQLVRVATGRFGSGGFSVDRVMRQIPDHFHAHARNLSRWRGVPRTTGPGAETGTGPSPG